MSHRDFLSHHICANVVNGGDVGVKEIQRSLSNHLLLFILPNNHLLP